MVALKKMPVAFSADVAVLQDKSRLKIIMKGGASADTATPLPVSSYRCEKPQRIWVAPHLATQEYVRTYATSKQARDLKRSADDKLFLEVLDESSRFRKRQARAGDHRAARGRESAG